MATNQGTVVLTQLTRFRHAEETAEDFSLLSHLSVYEDGFHDLLQLLLGVFVHVQLLRVCGSVLHVGNEVLDRLRSALSASLAVMALFHTHSPCSSAQKATTAASAFFFRSSSASRFVVTGADMASNMVFWILFMGGVGRYCD